MELLVKVKKQGALQEREYTNRQTGVAERFATIPSCCNAAAFHKEKNPPKSDADGRVFCALSGIKHWECLYICVKRENQALKHKAFTLWAVLIVVIVNQYISVEKCFSHLLMIYAKRSSLAMSLSVTAHAPRNCLNSSGSSGKLSQSIALSWALALVACLPPDVMARSALLDFYINPSSATMRFIFLNSSAFNCIAVIYFHY